MIYLNGVPINITFFPDRTSQVWKINDLDKLGYKVRIKWDFQDESEFLHLAQLNDLLRSLEERHFIVLELNYLPYGRQDKKISNETTFALRTFAALLNCLEFGEVYILDPHSDVALKLIERSKKYYPEQLVEALFEKLSVDLVCYPDEGALAKYAKIYRLPFIYALKVRDQLSGIIIGHQLIASEEQIKGNPIMIVDDICDGGRTFILVAQELKQKGASAIYLFVTHGIFSQGIDFLKDAGIDRIFTHRGEVVACKYKGYPQYENYSPSFIM